MINCSECSEGLLTEWDYCPYCGTYISHYIPTSSPDPSFKKDVAALNEVFKEIFADDLARKLFSNADNILMGKLKNGKH